MSDENPLAALHALGFGRPNPHARFEALRAALLATENAIAHQTDQLVLREQASRSREGVIDEDGRPDLALLHFETKELFSKVFRGGFLISIWAVFESCIKDLGEHVRRERDQPFGLQDLRAGDFLAQSEKYFRSTLDVAPFPDKTDRKQLELLKGLRNALVHHDGSTSEAPAELVRDPGLVTRVVDYHHEYVMPSAEYNRASLELVARISESLAERIYSLLHPKSRDV